MIIPFTLDPEVVSVYRSAPTVRSVVLRMADSKPQADFTYHGRSKEGGIAEHRIREVQEFGDLGTTYTNAVWYFSHHTTEAISELDSHIEHWDLMAKYLGREVIFKKIEGFINCTGGRILPACFAIHEADINDQAKKSYQEIEGRWTAKNTEQRHLYQTKTKSATTSQKQVIRKQEIKVAKESLMGFREDVSAWVALVKSQLE
jgi:hypothetical protein